MILFQTLFVLIVSFFPSSQLPMSPHPSLLILMGSRGAPSPPPLPPQKAPPPKDSSPLLPTLLPPLPPPLPQPWPMASIPRPLLGQHLKMHLPNQPAITTTTIIITTTASQSIGLRLQVSLSYYYQLQMLC